MKRCITEKQIERYQHFLQEEENCTMNNFLRLHI